MVLDRTLISYLPPFMREYSQLQAVFAAEQAEVEALWNACETALNDQFVGDATANGVGRWEKILKITAKPSDSLADRKFRILVKLNEQLPYTFTTLKKSLTDICGRDGYTMALDAAGYSLTVKVNLANKNNFEDVSELLGKVVPANIILRLELLYNQHSELGKFTHARLHGRTHYQLRNEVLT